MRYYMTERRLEYKEAPSPFLNPPREFILFPRRKTVETIGEKAYGYVDYRKFLSKQDIGKSGLVSEFGDIVWHQDSITEEFIESHIEELRNPKQMTPNLLTETLTYTPGFYMTGNLNVYAIELVRRAGLSKRLSQTGSPQQRRELIHSAAAAFNIQFL